MEKGKGKKGNKEKRNGRGVPLTHWIRARTNGSIREVFVANPDVLPDQ